jgi:hypothetical protein
LDYPYRPDNYHPALRVHVTDTVLYALADIWIACHARWHVGTFESNFDRGILELMAVQFAIASELYFKVERACVSAKHCRDVGYMMDYHAAGFANASPGETGGLNH